MPKYTQTFGVDISKDKFDVYSSKGATYQFDNGIKGFREFLKIVSKKSLVVMESTGYYHYSLAQFLHSRGRFVSVLNPIPVKRFIQMKLSKIKTDKSDARMICWYALQNETPLYHYKSKNVTESLQLISLIDSYIKERTSLTTKMQGEIAMGIPSKIVVHSLKKIVATLNAEIEMLDLKLIQLVQEEERDQLALLQSIPGIGIRTSMLLIVLTEGFSRFENARQLCSWAGITPTIKMSGSSVRGKSRISKMGNKKLRSLLFLCSFSACKHNKACRELYERLLAKGKCKKLALIAVCNKLLKQVFAVATKKKAYVDGFVSEKIAAVVIAKPTMSVIPFFENNCY